MISLDTPYVKCFVRPNTIERSQRFIECYIFGVTCILNRPLFFTCYTEDGGVYSRLPIQSFVHKKVNEMPAYPLQPWSVLGNGASVIQYEFLKDIAIKTKNGLGRYLFTIEQFDGGFSEDPEQAKSFNIIGLEGGFFTALPNNMFTVEEGFFKNSKTFQYIRQSDYFHCE